MKSTYFPCVMGTMGDWIYYVTVMGFAEIVQYVRFAEEVCPNEDLDKMIQREVTARSKEIAEYLRTHDQRFFGSLIVAAYDGQPRFLPIAFGDAPLLNQMEGRVGVLQFDGTEQYYALDGQHRLAALKLEVASNPQRYKEDQVSMIVICHSKDATGIARARRLFTTVNRYAKKTSPATHTAMSEDDGVAILTRRLIREHPLFGKRVKVLVTGRSGKVKLASGNAMSSSEWSTDRNYLMAIETFRKCNQSLLPEELHEEFSRQQRTPRFESLEAAFSQVSSRWNTMIDGVEPWKVLLQTETDLSQIRTQDGGHVLARPIGITAFVDAFATAPAIRAQRIKRVVDQFQDVAAAPWTGVLWNSASKRMNVTVEAQKLACRLWRYLLGLAEDRTTLEADWKASIDPRGERNDLQLPAPPA
jgi:DNA sulfur modification protein DndB